MPSPSTAIALATLLAPTVAICFSLSSAEPSETDVLELVNGETYSGELHAREIRVPEGVTVYADDTLIISAAELIQIDGTIYVRDVTDPTELNAPDLTIVSGDLLTIRGSVRGGRGRCLEHIGPHASGGIAGGNGTSITLIAPDLFVCGRVTAGAGGHGGGGADGGNGGWIHQTGHLVTDRHNATEEDLRDLGDRIGWVSGDGGRGGHGVPGHPHGGDGGDAGGITQEDHPDAPTWGFPEGGGSEGGFAVTPLAAALAVCDQGKDAPLAPARMGGEAADGGDGVTGTADSPNGGDAGDGGDAPDVAGANATEGQAGKDCCGDPSATPPVPAATGGAGGKGGASGNATAKKGGDGGTGGTAFHDGTAYIGDGGDAGDGGDGGSVTIKQGAKGGNGGKGVPGGAGGPGGGEGTGTPGPKGVKGTPGLGLTPGAAGTDGASGSVNGGGIGAFGNPGGGC